MKNTKKLFGINGREVVVTKPEGILPNLLASSKIQGLKLTWILILILIIGFGFAACNDGGGSSTGNNGGTGGGGGGGGGGSGSDKWADLVGEWEWEEGEESVNLKFNPDISLGIGYTIYYNSKKVGVTSMGTILWCSYDGTTLKVFDQDKKTSFTATVVKDGETLTISNYQHSSGSNYSSISGKTYTKQP